MLDGDDGAAARYLEFLAAGDSLYPLDALQRAGVDLRSPEPVEQTFAVLASLVDRIEELRRVKIELVPEPAPDDPAFLAATAAIEQTGLAADVRPAGNTSAWWRAGVHEAVDRGIAPRGARSRA